MRTIIMCMLKGVLFIVAMLAICVLFGEPNDTMSLCKVIMMKGVGVIVLAMVCRGYIMTLSDEEKDELLNE